MADSKRYYFFADDWAVWTDWYEARLARRHQPSANEELEVARYHPSLTQI